MTADELTYNGKSFKEFVVERTAAYINQVGAPAVLDAVPGTGSSCLPVPPPLKNANPVALCPAAE